MSLFTRSSAKTTSAVVATGVAIVLAITGAQPASTAEPAAETPDASAAARAFGASAVPRAGVYNVVLAQSPAASYSGGVRGYRRTAPVAGGKLAARSGAALRYRQLLARQQSAVLARIGSPRTTYRYTTALNGFSARLTSAQVVALRKDPSVLTVQRDRLVRATTVHTPRFLGLTGRRGVWARNGGAARAGRGVVVGVIDTGIWPENPSFRGRRGVPRIAGFRGACTPGERWTRSMCNSKIVGARYFNRVLAGGRRIAASDFLSPRDGDGHGSHTASTAAGNHGVRVTIEGQSFGRASGMAPAARIAVYKALWNLTTGEAGTGSTGDIVAAVDAAVRDGVDVINYSIGNVGGGQFTDPVNLAFMNAAAAGIFVAASAGNDGPAASTVDNNGPWITTTAASTSHLYQGAVVLGNGRRYVGAMISNRSVRTRPLVYSGDIASAGAAAEEAQACAPGSLAPARARGKIVVCDRGVVDRVAKSAEVRRAGGAGMVLANVDPNSTDADFHSVPTVHLDGRAASAVRGYARTPGARASLAADGRDRTRVPQIAEFSSRGPATPGEGDVMKPDLSAPGVSIVAAVAPPANSGRRWDLYSGTSMASPHVAGLAALIHARRPDWSPMEVKSAMMTTAYNLRGNRSPLTQGAGHVNPRRFLNPGLTFDSQASDWMGFLAGQGVVTAGGNPISLHPIAANQLNVPSIGISELVGRQTIRRRITNVTDRAERYTISRVGLPGITMTPRSRTITVQPRSTRTIHLTFTANAGARFDRFATGRIVLTGSRRHVVRMPVAIRPTRISVEDEVTGRVPAGSDTISGRAGFTGTLTAQVAGLQASTPVRTTLTPGPFDPFAPQADAHTYHATLVVPPGNGAVRFRVQGTREDDLDLFVYADGELVALSATQTADETITAVEVPAGTYDVYVNAFTAADGVAELTYDQWAVPPTPAGNLEVRPESVPVTAGGRFRLTATWAGLDPARNYFGYIEYGDTGHRTFVAVD